MNVQAPTIGHNSVSYAQMVESDPAVIFRAPETLASLVKEIEADIAAMDRDITSKSGREAIASAAHKISKRKTAIVAAGKSMTEEWRTKTAAVNVLKAKAEADLDALRDKMREPLTKWEAAETARIAKINATLQFLRSMSVVNVTATVESLRENIATVEATEIGPEFGDEASFAKQSKDAALSNLKAGLDRLVQLEAERAELAKMRAERDAAEQAAREVERQKQLAEAERQRVAAIEQRAKDEAEARVKAEAEAALAAERQKAQAAQRALEDEQRRQREADAKRAEEARQQAQREAAAKAEDARRAADQEHRGNIMRTAKEALMEHGGVKEEAAKKIVLAIVAGSIPHTSIQF